MKDIMISQFGQYVVLKTIQRIDMREWALEEIERAMSLEFMMTRGGTRILEQVRLRFLQRH